MKTLIIAIVCLCLGSTVAYLILSPSTVAKSSAEQSEKRLYTCGMHPEIISDEQGICPICNMRLIPKRESITETGGVKISSETKQNMGLVTSPVVYYDISKSINAFGKVVVPEPNTYQITIKTMGWVERLFVAENGEQVFKRQPLFEIYSPEIVTAQKELLIALSESDNPSMQRLAHSARQRLQNWDISDDQLAELEKSAKISRTMMIRSPVDGFVRIKNITEGSRVEPNKVLYDIVDISKVWITAQVYEQDLPHITMNQTGRVVIPSLPGRVFEGRVSYIAPLLDNRGQIEIRLMIDNAGFLLKPEMYAEVTIEKDTKQPVLAIPRNAVINSGKRQLVYVAESENTFKQREIITGMVGRDDMTEVVEGLDEGEAVVVSGQFLIDSESRLSEAINNGGETHNHQHTEQVTPANNDDPDDIHTCPMPEHSHILNYGPGKCPECGMDLVPITTTEHASVYVCPMPKCGPIMQEPGVCSHCGMTLEEHQPGGSNDK